jgi:hypothetical protein
MFELHIFLSNQSILSVFIFASFITWTNLQCPQHMLKDASALPRTAHLTATIADKIAKADRKILPDGSVT